jgi:hypothetical protein
MLRRISENWPAWRKPAIDLFVTLNLAFLALDIYLAHSINQFAHDAEWIPFYVSIVGAVLMAISLLAFGLRAMPGKGGSKGERIIGYTVGFVCLAVGLVGMVLHLESRFFQEMTLQSLVYSAPFVAPLAYAGLGLLLIMNHMVRGDNIEWGRWVVLLACAGFFGNFGLSVADHAQNGFFHTTEWIPVIVAALAVGCLIVASTATPQRSFLNLCVLVMGVQVLVGLIGLGLHFRVNYQTASDKGMFHDFVFGAPVFAPLLFPNLALLACIGLWDLKSRMDKDTAGQPGETREAQELGQVPSVTP